MTAKDIFFVLTVIFTFTTFLFAALWNNAYDYSQELEELINESLELSYSCIDEYNELLDYANRSLTLVESCIEQLEECKQSDDVLGEKMKQGKNNET